MSLAISAQSKVDLSYVVGSDELIGSYVHKEILDAIGSSGSWVSVQYEAKGIFKFTKKLVMISTELLTI